MTKMMLYGSITAKIFLVSLSIFLICVGMSMTTNTAYAEETEIVAETTSSGSSSEGMKYIAAAASVGLGSIAGGIAVAVVGSAAMGAVAERPELMGRSLIYVGLAEGIAIYGMVVAIMILIQ